MEKRIAIVTGASRGIGRSIAQKLSADGFFVVMVVSTDIAGCETLRKEIGTDKSSAHLCHIGKSEPVAALFAEVMKQHGRVDVVVNNAGIIRDNMIWKMSEEDFDTVINVNLKGTWLMCKEAAKIMKEQKSGRIINISSRAWLGNRGQSNYSASKGGVNALTRVLALELGKFNVLVNAVAPGLIETPMTQALKPEVQQQLIDAQPTKTMGKPEDVANVVAFLSSEKAQFITGQLIYVDGGKSIGAGS